MTPPVGVPRLGGDDLSALDAIVAPADARMARLYPGDDGRRQPVHTVYVPADQVTPDLSERWGSAARQALQEFAPTPQAFGAALGLWPSQADDLAGGVWERVLAKLDTEPVEDLRIDLEDGYGVRDDATEDRDAVAAAEALVAAVGAGLAPAYCGIRFKSLEAATRRRGLRTLDLVLGTVLAAGPLPDGWVVTLPKVTSLEHVEAMVEACGRLETAYGLPERRLRFEIQVETAQSVLAYDGSALVARLIHAGDGRVSGLHFGTYDYTAGLGIAADYQAMDHPAAEHAKHVMAVAAAQTGVHLCDGSSNRLPVGDVATVHEAWATHARLVRGSLERGFYQGWDLHPAQLPTRFAATYLFFRRGLHGTVARLRRYLGLPHGDLDSEQRGGRADPGSEQPGGGSANPGQYLDEPATAQALAQFVLRGLDCGAVAVSEVGDDTVVTQLRHLTHRRRLPS